MSTSDASTDLAATVAANIRTARLAAGLTQQQLADRIDGAANLMAVSRWERGEHRPSLANLTALADVLGCDVAWFFTDHEKEKAA